MAEYLSAHLQRVRSAGQPFTVRRASRADLRSISDLNAAAYAVYRIRMDGPPAPVSHDYTPEIEAGQVWLAAAAATGLQNADSAEVLGLIVLIATGDSLLIENIAVAPAAQGRGLGRHLMAFAERQAVARGLSRLTLYTNEVMTENIAIYARLGYRETARHCEHGYKRVFMEKRLH